MPPSANGKLLRIANPVVGDREREYVNQALATGWISSQGEFVSRFEQNFSRYCNVAHGIAVANGTVALHLALAALGIGPGDEVIVPTLSHIAVATAVTLVGAKMVLVDSDYLTWGMDPTQVDEKISSNTKAIIVVHLYGHPVDMDPIVTLASRHNIPVIEDAAEAHGATYKGRRAGSLGDLASFSFYANKLITTGEGGMLVTSNPEYDSRCRKLRDQAYEPGRKFVHAELGFNYRLTNIQAAIGVAQLERIDDFLTIRRGNALEYNQRLAALDGITLPPEQPWAQCSYWMYSILVGSSFPLTRDALMAKLLERGIESRPFFYPLHRQPFYKNQFASENFPVAESLAETGMNLPSGNELTHSDIEFVTDTLHKLADGR